MISTKEELKRCITCDMSFLNGKDGATLKQYMKRGDYAEYQICRYLELLRKEEYYINRPKSTVLSKLLLKSYERKKNSLGNKLGLYIPPNCFDEGLTVYHHGTVIVNPNSKIGKNCKIHGNNCIGNNGITDGCPKIGDNVDIGFGAVIIGDIEIADSVKIGANAVVNKSFIEKGITIAGIPARKVITRTLV